MKNHSTNTHWKLILEVYGINIEQILLHRINTLMIRFELLSRKVQNLYLAMKLQQWNLLILLRPLKLDNTS